MVGGELKVSVVGLGYVGLPTALAFHDAGHYVSGIDIANDVIESLKNGKSHLIDSVCKIDIPVNSDRWLVSDSFEDSIVDSKIVLITVPTPVNPDKSPDLGYVKKALDSVLMNIDPNNGTIVVLESTVYPGVTRSITKEVASGIGLSVGKDFHIAYSPERVSPGEVGRGASEVTRIVGAQSREVVIYLAGIYSQITTGGCKYVGQIEVAEAAKMVENTQRDIDIAFVNELAKVLPRAGLDTEKVLEAAGTKWNFHKHQPGIGVGGHCIPVDPYYYIELGKSVGVEPLMSMTARGVNESMPRHVVGLVEERIGKLEGLEVLVLGYSYKPEIGDTRETPVLEICERLIQLGSMVSVCDPYLERGDVPIEMDFIALAGNKEFDIAILATPHQKILEIDWSELLKRCRKRFIFDGRRSLDWIQMVEMGWDYSGVGVPNDSKILE